MEKGKHFIDTNKHFNVTNKHFNDTDKYFIEFRKDIFISAGCTSNKGRELNMRTGETSLSLRNSPGRFRDLYGSVIEIPEELRILSKVFWIFLGSGREIPKKLRVF